MKTKATKPVIFALLAAVLYALSTPLAKLILTRLSPTLVAGLLYLGAGLGIGLVKLLTKKNKTESKPFSKKDVPSIIGMILLDILAPILLLIGLRISRPESVALLNNFEIVATAVFAAFIFKEVISKRLWLAILFITLGSIVLSFDDLLTFKLSWGSLLVLGATIAWGLENNLTRKLSHTDVMNVVIIKGIFAGLGSIVISLIIKEFTFDLWPFIGALGLGFVAYGLSIYLYVSAQKDLGAARTAAFYGVAPFFGAIISLIIFQHWPMINFYVSILFLLTGFFSIQMSRKTD
jgi:drug/metabolite transporter (DMT)-like permease